MTKIIHHHKKRKPLYLQIASELRQGIVAQKWQPGDLLPSETILSNDYGVARGTVVKAIEVLLQEGLAQRRQGVGTFVSRPALHRQPGFLQGFAETVLGQGRVPSQQLLEVREMPRNEALQYGCHEPAILMHRIRFVDDIPWAIHKSLIPLPVAKNIPALQVGGKLVREAANFSLFQAFGDAGYVTDHADESVQSRLATQAEAAMLKVELPAAVMMVHRKSHDPHGQLLELIEAVYLGGSYTYATRLVRTYGMAALHTIKPQHGDRGDRGDRGI